MSEKPQIVAVDAGNGGTNAILHRAKGKHKQFYQPSVRAAATGDTLGLGEGFEIEYSYTDWNGHRYVVGDDVTRVTKRSLERHMGSLRYGDEFHQFLVANAIAHLGIKEGEVDLTVFAPPGMFVEARQIMQERFMAEGGEVVVRLKGDKQPRSWRYSQISVWPEGLSAAACLALDEKGQPTGTGVLQGETMVLDSGVYTFDALKMTDGSFNVETLEHATWDNGGLDVHIRQPILRALKKHSPDMAVVTVDDIDRVIRRGLVSGDYTLVMGGDEIDLHPLIERYRERYAEWIANNIIDGAFNGLRGIRSTMLVGGGAILIEDHLRQWYGDKIMDRKKHAATKKIDPVDMNAIGGIRLALAGAGR